MKEPPCLLYTFASELDGDYSKDFEFYSTENVSCGNSSKSHAIKLNILADIICFNADEDDYVIFLDGDAFPIKPFWSDIKSLIDIHQFVAIRRDANNGDRQPHPSFTATTISSICVKKPTTGIATVLL